MAIDRNTIINAASNTSYRMGQDIFLINKRIIDFEADSNPFTDTQQITATVMDSDGRSNTVAVSVDESSNQITNCSCSCSDFGNENGLCRHLVAALLKYISRRHLYQTSHSSIRNERLSKSLIQAYATHGICPHGDQPVTGAIELEPILHLENSRFSLEFKIGTHQKYVVRDLLELVRLISCGDFFEYGKNLKFYHEPDAFSENSRPLLDFIIQTVNEYKYYFQYSQENTYSFRTLKPIRQLPLSPKAVDNFFTLMTGRSIKLNRNSKVINIQILNEDPQIAVSLTNTENLIWRLTMEDCEYITGEKYGWLLKDSQLYHCSEAFSMDMHIFFTEMIYSGNQGLYLSSKQMIPFCGSVLKIIQPHIELTTDTDLSAFTPPEVSFSIYLDHPDANAITCKAYAHYGDEKISITAPINYETSYRDATREHQVLSAIRTWFQAAPSEIDDDFIIENDDHAIFLFLEQGLAHFYQLGDVYVSENMRRIRVVTAPKATIGVSISGNLLSLDIQSKDLPYEELAGILANYRKRKKYYRLKSGEYLRLEDNSLSVLSELADGLHLSEKEIKNGTIALPLYRASYIDSVLTHHSGDIQTQRDRYFKSLIRDLKSVEDSDFEVPGHLKHVLRDYQKTGYRWLCTLDRLGFGGILADDMGLGKTIQIITLLAAARADTVVSLIICPASLVYNWESEIERFAPELRTLLITGTARERQEKLTRCQDYDVLITSYDMLKRDIDAYTPLSFHYQIIDEAQYIKNHHTLAARAVCRIQSVTRFALTGTPIENRLSELWSIFEYLMPGFLYPYQYFKAELEQPIVENADEIASERLKHMIRPFIMRRLKSDVLKELPEKLENAVFSRMTDEQQRLYDANVAKLQHGLEMQSDAAFNNNKIQILAELTKLRQLCCDPALIYEKYDGGSAKLDTCIQLIQNAMAGGHRVLLFSQFTSMLDIIEHRLQGEHTLYYRLDGSTRSDHRTKLVNDFNHNRVPVFLISLKAGGTGLNLTGADIVIHYDPWWNIAAQNQATDRAHRIGQTRTVTVYKLITRHSIEEQIMKLQESKRKLADQIISGEGISAAQLTREDLMNILQ